MTTVLFRRGVSSARTRLTKSDIHRSVFEIGNCQSRHQRLDDVTTASPSRSLSYRQQRPRGRHLSSHAYFPEHPHKCPYNALGVPKSSSYSAVKKSFLKIAMTHHPDTHDADWAEEEREQSLQIFLKARKAFESLVKTDDGLCAFRADVEAENELKRRMSDEEFDAWFKNETGHDTPFQFDIDPATMREVAEMTEELHSDAGLDRDGGMWHLASLVSASVKNTKDGKGGAESLLRLEAGEVAGPGERPGSSLNGSLRRRRRASFR